ncbi:GDP-L-fucose synthase family protein [Pseudohalocynthiibacter aestuariivivens]|jgi:GDP-L-fucose synthase|uniref:GDP-L-fucose synthase n=1 Tax=Pseudohalocynthiibacter aestuariivivens TaxID=1591409 RepID=A0ABV5JBT7_9RHOB|nr:MULTISPECIES: GDP-L-fucose synthase [Pseudohalocynthiibacter]MBS9718659.1 GDP-L-fucose synthase [Pseudohalocynthiibacter aestuariivivens]MCK0104135.1 GDP-L-fucose synthase [Pseudohalocynthiibacter sp. F2068]
MKILITGGSGMVGKNLIEHAAAKQHELVVPSREELDLLSYEKTSDLVKAHTPDLIIHCAGQVGGIHANIADPAGFLVNNLDMGRNIVLSAQAAGVSKLLNLGSSCMYPRLAENPLREEQVLTGELEPTNEGYALAKITVARLCSYLSATKPNLHYKTLMPCNLFGKHDKFDPKVSHLLPAIVKKMHDAKTQGLDSVEIWGDGTVRREFMFASDMADGTWYMVDRFERLPDMMNLGVGHDYSINEYYEAAAKVIGWKGKFTHDLSKPVGMKQKLLSVSRQTELGWAPKTSLEEGIQQTYQFFLDSQS